MASAAGAPRVCSLRTIKSDVVVGLESNAMADRLDKEEPGWKISGKYVSRARILLPTKSHSLSRLSYCCPRVDLAKRSSLREAGLDYGCALYSLCIES